MIVTRQSGYRVDGATMAPSIETALNACKNDNEVFVIGGAQLYAAAMPRANRLYLTVVAADVDGDARMPDFDLGVWEKRSAQSYAADDKNPYDYVQTVYERASTHAAA